jgi:hypothetical protein
MQYSTGFALVAGDPWSVHASPEQGRCIQLFMYARSRCATGQLVVLMIAYGGHCDMAVTVAASASVPAQGVIGGTVHGT